VIDKTKEFRYAIGLDRAGRLTADGRSPLDLDVTWTPEHLMLAGLARCTLQSFRFHAARAGLDFLASASASGVVTKRREDGGATRSRRSTSSWSSSWSPHRQVTRSRR
jgi:organic hydroperoxide reductase OsmC/OhrA